MPLPVPEPGLVVNYSYLWHSEYEQDQEEGLKDRPCAIILVAEDAAGETLVTVVPITHSAPASEAVEIPLAVKRRLGLAGSRPASGDAGRSRALRLRLPASFAFPADPRPLHGCGGNAAAEGRAAE